MQKGPFLNGTSIMISELSGEMVQTGRTFTTQISDNRGSFELNQLELNSPYVQMEADGYYYNEVAGVSSSSRLILYALSSIEEKTTLNVNVLSHLERGRVLKLISEGMDFITAKKQAQQEVLGIFSLTKADMMDSELLDISRDGTDDAILLAISLILQGQRSEGELSELLANIYSDLAEDGELNSASTGSALVNHARWLNLQSIRANLEARYEATGLAVTLPDFEPYVRQFLSETPFEATEDFDYPQFTEYGENILFPGVTEVTQEREYSMGANLPAGAGLKIRLSGGLWGYQTHPHGPVNWIVSDYNWETESQIFTSAEAGQPCDLNIVFFYEADSTLYAEGILVEYFENMSDTVTRTKVIRVKEF